MYPKRIAAIDLGTNSFHLVIAELKDIDKVTSIEEFESKGNFEILYRQREVVRINVGNKGETNLLPQEGIERAIKVLKEFKDKIDQYGAITHAIATSAIREAENRDEFLNYVKDNLGIEIKIVSGYEEARLIYLGVLQGLNVYDKKILLIDIGGGSTELLIGRRGKILYAASFKLGAVRLTQKFFSGGKSFSHQKKSDCEKYINEVIADNLKLIKQIGFDQVVGTSGEIQTIARLLYLKEKEIGEYKNFHNIDFNINQFNKVAEKILQAETIDELTSIPNLDGKRAEIVVAGTLILKIILKKLKIEKMTVSAFALREGIIIDAIEKFYRKELSTLTETASEDEKKSRIKSVIELARSYNVDLTHAQQVSKISLTIFDELREIHKLDNQARELLHYAAILHDIGYYISPIKHHKHSYFIIKNSELIGFNEKEINMIANIARYHRKAKPDNSHINLKNFNKEEIKILKILSAILRMADGLEKTHSALINDIKLIKSLHSNSFILVLRYLTYPPEAEYWAAQKRKKVLEEILKITLELKLEKINLEY